MTRKEAFEFYEKLVRTGKLSEFNEKDPEKMTKEEREFFYYDDGRVMYNPFVRKMDSYHFPFEKRPKVDLDVLETKKFSELTKEELRDNLGIYD